MRTMVWWYRLGLTPNSSTRVPWQPWVLSGGPVTRDITGASRRMGEENVNLVYPSPWDCKRSLTCCKILRHWTSGFTSHPKEGVLLTFIALKYSSLWPGSNLRPLGPVERTLTTTPPRPLINPFLYLTKHTTVFLHAHCNSDIILMARHFEFVARCRYRHTCIFKGNNVLRYGSRWSLFRSELFY
jgi:hypothetical protein